MRQYWLCKNIHDAYASDITNSCINLITNKELSATKYLRVSISQKQSTIRILYVCVPYLPNERNIKQKKDRVSDLDVKAHVCYNVRIGIKCAQENAWYTTINPIPFNDIFEKIDPYQFLDGKLKIDVRINLKLRLKRISIRKVN